MLEGPELEGQKTILLWVVKVVVYGVTFFLPLLVARWRDHPHALAIGILCLLFPVTFVLPLFVLALLWIAALMWALFPVAHKKRDQDPELPEDA